MCSKIMEYKRILLSLTRTNFVGELKEIEIYYGKWNTTKKEQQEI
jgi:hypothetical protein